MKYTQPENRGLLTEPIVFGKDGVFGSATSYAGKHVVRPDGQWDTVEYERQSSGDFDTFSCVSFGLNNQEELYMLNRYGIKKNHSDRALARMSDTQPNGNTPQKVYEARRKKGFLFENEWPWPFDVKEWSVYMMEIPRNLIILAIGYSAEWRFWHDYVPMNPVSIKEALKYSPVAVSVALMPDENGVYYKPVGWRDTHFAVLRGYYDNGDWKLLDTYLPYEKRVRSNTIFEVGKVIEIQRQIINEAPWVLFINWMRKTFGL